MIVRMTGQQVRSVRTTIMQRMDERRAELITSWLDENSWAASKHRVDTLMPACYWRAVEQMLFDVVFDARGFRAKDVSRPLHRGMIAIRAAMNVRELHPALSNKAVIGRVHEIIPVWITDRTWVYPLENAVFSVLAPTTIEVGGTTATKWVEAPELVNSRLMLTESTHLALFQ